MLTTSTLRACVLALATALFSCQPAYPAPAPAPNNTSDDCTNACQHLEVLKCEEAKPTPAGATCVKWCNEYRQTPAGVDPVCMAKVKTCAEVDRCGR